MTIKLRPEDDDRNVSYLDFAIWKKFTWARISLATFIGVVITVGIVTSTLQNRAIEGCARQQQTIGAIAKIIDEDQSSSKVERTLERKGFLAKNKGEKSAVAFCESKYPEVFPFNFLS